MSYKKWKSVLHYFKKEEIALWCASVSLIIAAFFLFDRENCGTLAASLIGVTSLIFNAKGNPIGQILMVAFSVLYGAVFALISWLKNPYNGNKTEVRVNRLKRKEILFMLLLAAVVTVVFYYILAAFHTANLILSTISVTTSFIAVYLTFRRSAFYAVAYAANDIVLIVLWILASFSDVSYLSVVICFVVFFANDIYGFFSWWKMQQRQEANHNCV